MTKAGMITVVIIILALTILAIILIPRAIEFANSLNAEEEQTYKEIDDSSSMSTIEKPVHALCVLVLSF